jgi:putative transcriptional regulator
MRTVSYDPLWKTLVDHHMNKMELKEAAGLSKGTITKMGKNESVTVDVLTRICNALDCDVYDVLEIKEHGEEA